MFGFNAVQMDTTMNWPTSSRTNPPTFLAIDPFSDSALYDGVVYKMYDELHAYYLPGMSRDRAARV